MRASNGNDNNASELGARAHGYGYQDVTKDVSFPLFVQGKLTNKGTY